METNLIEKYDSSRTSLLTGIAIGWSIYYGIFILNDIIHNSLIIGIMNIVGLFGLGIFLFGMIRMMRIKRILRNNPDLQRALNNELVVLNRWKAYTVGFYTFLSTTMIGLLLTIFANVSAKIVLELILFAGILSLLLTSIILNKRG